MKFLLGLVLTLPAVAVADSWSLSELVDPFTDARLTEVSLLSESRAESEHVAYAREEKKRARKEALRITQDNRAVIRDTAEQQAALNKIFAGLQDGQGLTFRESDTASEMNRYGAIFRQLIQQNLQMKASYKGQFCKLNLQLQPTGRDMLTDKVTILSGHGPLCAAVKKAVAKVGSFPQPQDEEVTQKLRRIILTVSPK